MKPLEAVARAVSLADRCEECDLDSDMPCGLCFNTARAAITALRDAGVTEGMRAAADDVVATYPGYGDRYELDAEFRAMLDAAIAEGS